jgi:hypothetical protein
MTFEGLRFKAAATLYFAAFFGTDSAIGLCFSRKISTFACPLRFLRVAPLLYADPWQCCHIGICVY